MFLVAADNELALADVQAANRLVEKFREEARVSKEEATQWSNRRAFAFKERDKAVLERDGIRALCDTMRSEREKSVAELADSVRSCDEVKRQRSDLMRECQELRELLEHRSLRGNPRAPMLQNVAHNDSRDSAIDTEFLSDVFSETFEVDLNIPNPE